MNASHRPSARALALAVGAYALLAVILTWPAAARLGQAVMGLEARDNLQYTWLLWWTPYAWEHGQSPAQVTLMNHPWQVEHPLLDVTLELEALAYPFQKAFGPTAAYNLLMLLSFILCGLAMYLLVFDLTRQPLAAFVGGLIFALFPHRMGHALAGHLSQMALWWGPLYLRHLLRLFDTPRWRDALWMGLWLGLSLSVGLVVSAYYALPLAVLSALYLFVVRRQAVGGRLLGRLAVGWGGAFLLIAPKYVPFLLRVWQGRLDYRVADFVPLSVDALALVTPSRFHPLWGDFVGRLEIVRHLFPSVSEVERTAYMGITVLGLAALGWLHTRRQGGLWLFLGGVALLLALGPSLQIGGIDTGVPLPYAVLQRVPILSWGRTPERFLALTMFSLAVLAAMGLAAMPKWRFVQGGIICIVVLDMLVLWPWPDGTPAPPSSLRGWTAQGGAVLHLPASKRQVSNTAMYYQTAHHLPIVGGYIHRELPGMREYTKALDAACIGQAAEAERPLTPAELRGLLQGLDIRYVVVDRRWVSERQSSMAAERMEAALGPWVEDWKTAVVFQVPPLEGRTALAEWEDLELLGVEVAPRTPQPGQTITLHTWWRAKGLISANKTLYIHILNERGERIAQNDGPPLGGNWPTTFWAPSTLVLDEREIALPAGLPAGAYSLGIGWYDATSHEAVRLVSAPDALGEMAIFSQKVNVR